MAFDHTLDNTLTACGITAKDILSVAFKIKAELDNSSFTAYTDKEQLAILVLATSADNSLLYNTLNFVDKSVCSDIDTQSQLVENLLKYPPTVEQIYKTLAVCGLNKLAK